MWLQLSLIYATIVTTFTQDVPEEDDLRIVNGDNFSKGRLEIYHNGQWGTIWGDSRLDCPTFGEVACYQLDFAKCDIVYHSYATERLPYQTPIEPPSMVWLDGGHCDGTETKIADCRYYRKWGHGHYHFLDVAIECSDTPNESNESFTEYAQNKSDESANKYTQNESNESENIYTHNKSEKSLNKKEIESEPNKSDTDLYFNIIETDGTQKTIRKIDFDSIIGSHDFTFINFGAEWSYQDRRFGPSWREAEYKSNGMIFSDKNEKQAVVKLLHIHCVPSTSQDLCADIGIRAYPTVRLYKRDGRFVVYPGERKVDSILDFVKSFVETETIQKRDIDVDDKLDDYDDIVEYDDTNAYIFESVSCYYVGILIGCIGIIGIIILYWVCFNKKQKEAKEPILLYHSITIQTNLGEQEGI